MQWLFDSKKRFGLCVLDYVVASNHIHLLVKDSDEDVIAPSMQLIAGRTAQQYNRRKQRKGAFWEDRYHATAIETDARLQRCLVYIDLNMVRAGGVQHPSEWQHGGYCEIQRPHARYAVIDLGSLSTFVRVPGCRAVSASPPAVGCTSTRTRCAARAPGTIIVPAYPC